MSFVRAKAYLKKFNLEDRIMEFPVSSKTVDEAALAINCRREEIGKSLSFLVNDKPIIVVVSGDSKIDNGKYKKEFLTKAKMIPYDAVLKLIGHDVGGVCPFGVNDDVSVYLDISLKKLEIVYPACGTSNSGVKLTVAELEKIGNIKKWVDVCKNVSGE